MHRRLNALPSRLKHVRYAPMSEAGSLRPAPRKQNFVQPQELRPLTSRCGNKLLGYLQTSKRWREHEDQTMFLRLLACSLTGVVLTSATFARQPAQQVCRDPTAPTTALGSPASAGKTPVSRWELAIDRGRGREAGVTGRVWHSIAARSLCIAAAYREHSVRLTLHQADGRLRPTRT